MERSQTDTALELAQDVERGTPTASGAGGAVVDEGNRAMRLVGWSANYNNHRRTFEENVALLGQFNADVLVISETAPPQPGDSAFFVGDTPGLAVAACDGIELRPHSTNDGAPPLIASFRVVRPLNFDLLATWTVEGKRGSYPHLLMAALERYADLWAAGLH